MEQVYTPKRQVRRLEEDEIIESFSCGDADLDDFIVNEAPFYRDALLAVSYVMDQDDKPIAYFSLANPHNAICCFSQGLFNSNHILIYYLQNGGLDG